MLGDIITGKTRSHLGEIGKHYLHQAVIKPFEELQKSARLAGFNLQIASAFRDFERQKLIWNEKFCGIRRVHNSNGESIDLSSLNDWQKCQAILEWSALPALSRHHWGTDIDIFDPDLLPIEQRLQLEPWEYTQGGYFYDLSQWLLENAPRLGFKFPFLNLPEPLKIGAEPWHLSYAPLANELVNNLNPELILSVWEGESLAGEAMLLAHLNEIFKFYVAKEI